MRQELEAVRSEQEHHEYLLRERTEHQQLAEEPEQDPPAQGQPEEDEPDPDPEELEAREHEEGMARLESLMTAFEQETVDPVWAGDMEAQIAASVATRPGTTLTSATCRSTQCFVELEHESSADRDRAASTLLGRGLSHGFLMHEGGGTEGPYRTVLILGRETLAQNR